MEIRVCNANDVIELLQLARDDDEKNSVDTWEQYQKWLLDSLYTKNNFVYIAVDNGKIVGFLVWNLFIKLFKWTAYLGYIYVSKDKRNREASSLLVKEFIKAAYKSPAQRFEFSSKVLPSKWVKYVSLNVPHDKYMTYHIKRSDEIREWYNENIREN